MTESRTMPGLRLMAPIALVMLAACGTVDDKERSSIVVDGVAYEVRKATLAGPDGPIERTTIKVRSQFYACLPDSPGDCEAVVRNARDQRPGGN